jgi:hypothetical protein
MRGSLVWPLVLITVGALALLANFGLISFSWSALFGLWPLLLILIGIELLVARRAPLLALALQIGAIVIGLALVVGLPRQQGPATAAISVPREGATRLEFSLEAGAGRFELRGGATELVQASSTREDLVHEVDRRGDRVDVEVRPAAAGFFTRIGETAPASWQLRIASDVSSEIRVAGGAGEFILDLRDVRVTEARVSTGASDLSVVLPKPTGEVEVRIDSGASSIEIEVPPGVEARVSTTGPAISVSGRSETANYASARDRVRVTINAGASSVTIR